MSFDTLGLSAKTLAAAQAAGYSTPTPIQMQAIPIALSGRDVVGIAQTGTGKTGAFVLPLLTRLEGGRARARMPRTLILEPTRELAAQVVQAFELLGTEHRLNVALLIGGVSFGDQERKLERGADVVIATPGRLLDLMGRGKLLMSGVEVLVIDEADRMLDMGFIPDIERICAALPPTRQTLFFSATMPPEIQRLTAKFLNNPQQVEVSRPASAAPTITQTLRFVGLEPAAKRAALRDLINAATIKNAIIFCNRKRDVATLHRSLLKHGFSAGALHGDLDQRQRTRTLDAFRRGEIMLLAASDVAARGLDIPEVSHVFNFDVPISPEDYIHRIGRTGRAGREGAAAMLVTPQDGEALRAIEKLLGGAINWQGDTPDADAFEASGRRKRGRGSRGSAAPAAERGRRGGSREPAAGVAGEGRASAGRGDRRGRGDGEGARPSRQPVAAQRAQARDDQSAVQKDATQPQPRTARPTSDAINERRDGRQSGPAEPRPENQRSGGSRREAADAANTAGSEQLPAFLTRPIRRQPSEAI